jgi:hypothetical protein
MTKRRGERTLSAIRQRAERRVAIGIRFITHRRKLRGMPPDWARNFLIYGCEPGQVWIHTNICYNNECPLALAFSDVALFANGRYVTEASVLHHLPISRWRLIAMGFDMESGEPFDTAEQNALNEEWGRQVWHALYSQFSFPRRHDSVSSKGVSRGQKNFIARLFLSACRPLRRIEKSYRPL